MARTDDGRPVYLQMGAHHAREWPSGELPRVAVDLVKRYHQGDARVGRCRRVRVVVVPVVNVDGFAVSRGPVKAHAADDDENLTPGSR